MNLIELGIILICLPVAAGCIWHFGSRLYFMIDCLVYGGDWKYWAGEVITDLVIGMMAIGVGLFFAGIASL